MRKCLRERDYFELSLAVSCGYPSVYSRRHGNHVEEDRDVVNFVLCGKREMNSRNRTFTFC